MVKTLQKHADGQALVLDEALMKALGIDADSPLELTVSGGSLIVTPVEAGVGREKVDEVVDGLRDRYGSMLENLAR